MGYLNELVLVIYAMQKLYGASIPGAVKFALYMLITKGMLK